MVYLSPRHGVNPSLDVCFLCQEPRGLVLFGRMGTSVQKALGANYSEMRNDPEAPRKLTMDMEPCDKCKGYMEKGIILISVDEKLTEDMKNPYRTGGWCVVKEEAVRRWGLQPAKLLEDILKKRVAFLPDDAWDFIGLPRRPVEGVPDGGEGGADCP